MYSIYIVLHLSTIIKKLILYKKNCYKKTNNYIEYTAITTSYIHGNIVIDGHGIAARFASAWSSAKVLELYLNILRRFVGTNPPKTTWDVRIISKFVSFYPS